VSADPATDAPRFDSRTAQRSSGPADLIISGASEVITGSHSPDVPLTRITGGAVAIRNGRISAVGTSSTIAAVETTAATQVIDARGKVVAPGFVDSHTHLVFGGSRVQEYAARLTRSAVDVRALGIPSGIGASVAMTRSATAEELADGACRRLQQMLAHGTTTVESKTGYGLTVAGEMRMLEVNKTLRMLQVADIRSTFLGAHAFPPEMSPQRYIDLLIHEMIPSAAGEGGAEFCDVFCDDGYYSVDQARQILEAGRAAGMQLKIHTDQYSALGGSLMAAELGVVSADHLNFTPPLAARRMADTGVVGVVTPLLDFAVQHPRPSDSRMLLDAGLPLALATDLCPGCWVESMPLVIQYACRCYRLTPEAAFWAATSGGARALTLSDRGTLDAGQVADIQVWDVSCLEELVYRLGHNPVEMVFREGRLAYQRP
jgi:imidazolonepropionase